MKESSKRSNTDPLSAPIGVPDEKSIPSSIPRQPHGLSFPPLRPLSKSTEFVPKSSGISLPLDQLLSMEWRDTPVGIKQVQDVDAAMKYAFKEHFNPLIVLCGWPR